MKRIHLFEAEDFEWFPHWLRRCITRLILVMHNLVGTGEKMADLVAETLKKTNSTSILDLCSGSGGPMPEVLQILQEKHGMENVTLIMTDLYPDLEAAKKFNNKNRKISYQTSPVNATQIDGQMNRLRTMVGSFHHFAPHDAKQILGSAQESRESICIFEISDNGQPIWIWWIAFPINFIMTFFITPMVRPMTWQQLVFTYLIPIIPICFAWDGAVSNARTYTLEDLEELLGDIKSENYGWEKGKIEGKTNQLYLIGFPD